VPLVAGQIVGVPALGLAVGLGGLYLSVTDKEGSTLGSLVCAALLNGAAVLAGCLIGGRVWPSIAAMATWAFLAGMASGYGEVVSQMGFISTVTFAVALGLDGGFAEGARQTAAFVAGGLWGVALTYALWRFSKKTSELSEAPDDGGRGGGSRREILRVFGSNFTFRSIVFRHALRLSLASAVAVALYKILRMERGYWLIITVNVVVLDLLLIVFSVLAYSHVRHNYGFYVLFLTPFVVLMIETVQPMDWRIVLTRIFDTLVGAAIALVISFLLRPRSAFGW
jgi:hypothetical protein